MPSDTPRLGRGREQIAEHAVGVVRGAGDDQQVSGPAELDGHMEHPVVAGLSQDGDGTAGGLRVWVDWTDTRLEQTGAALGLWTQTETWTPVRTHGSALRRRSGGSACSGFFGFG